LSISSTEGTVVVSLLPLSFELTLLQNTYLGKELHFKVNAHDLALELLEFLELLQGLNKPLV
jgi:hypothetical protein